MDLNSIPKKHTDFYARAAATHFRHVMLFEMKHAVVILR